MGTIRETWRLGWLVKVFCCCCVVGAVLIPDVGEAVECERRACRRGGHYKDGHCHYSSGFPTFAKSHSVARCPSGYTLDRARGVCVTSGRCCEDERRACRRGGRYRDGHCYYSSGFPTFAKSHSVARCPSGYTLDRARGVCTRGCRG